MSAFSTANFLLFPGLGLVALAIGLLARRYSASALGVGLVGLLSLATASTWIIAAVPAKHVSKPAPKTEAAKPQSPTLDLERLKQELLAEKAKSAQAERHAADADRSGTDTTARIAALNSKVREFQAGKEEAERRVALLEKQLTGAQSAPTAPKPPDLPGILLKLAEGDGHYYAAKEERALIPGKRGAWYGVRLLQGGKDWSFADRQFVLADPTAIKASAARLRDDVLRPLTQAGQRWQLFVRGAADPRPVAGPVGRELVVLPRLPDGLYSPAPRAKQVTLPVQNEELPTLRADWLREIVRPVLGEAGMGEIDILENPPQSGHGRTAEFVLFVEG